MSDEEKETHRPLSFVGPAGGRVVRLLIFMLPAVVALLLMMLAREVIVTNTPVKAEISRSDASFCDFGEWVGQPVNSTDVTDLGRPYRIIERETPPREHTIEERINLQMDDNGLIVRVWCG